jgi:PhzF family phenazine biosynthesis protein
LGEGNPAAVVIEEGFQPALSDNERQLIAFEMNKSETAFVCAVTGSRRIKWFSPKKEMPLCGHATLAAAKVLYEKYPPQPRRLSFLYGSGADSIDIESADGRTLAMFLPMDGCEDIPVSPIYSEFFGDVEFSRALVGLKTGKVILVAEPLADLAAIKPNFALMACSEGPFSRGIGITQRGKDCDFVSRYFNPWAGVNEDPVTGSVHTVLVDFWAKELGKTSMRAAQKSHRPGLLDLSIEDGKVRIEGRAKIILEGTIEI